MYYSQLGQVMRFSSVAEDGPGTNGIAVFDDLPKAERLALVAAVANGLSDKLEYAHA